MPPSILIVIRIPRLFSFPGWKHLWQFYLVYALLFTGNGALGGIVAGAAVNNWFIRKRGKTMGIATAGMSLSWALLLVLLKKEKRPNQLP